MAQELFSVRRNRLAMRLSVLRLTVTVLMVGVALSYWFIQIVQHDKFQQLAENNHRRSVSLRAPRGILFDRDGTVLVENRYSFDISIVRELTTDLEYLINKLVAITGIQLRDVQDEIDRYRQLPDISQLSLSVTPRWRRWRQWLRAVSNYQALRLNKCRVDVTG